MQPLKSLIKLLENRPQDVQDWFDQQWKGTQPLPYFSCDVRHASFKLGIVDTNLFPGGFNNLCNAFTQKTAQAFQNYFKSQYPNVKKITLLAENHTRNKFYLLNILKIQCLLQEAGYPTIVTMPLEAFPQNPIQVPLTDDKTLEIHDPQTLNLAEDQHIVLSNNDFSSGIPEVIAKQNPTIIPHPNLGWHKRKKSSHFQILASVTQKFSQTFNVDPWHITPMATVAQATSQDLSQLAEAVDDLVQVIQKKYDEYGIAETPYIFVKNDSGTYGLGMINVANGQELLALNRKKRNKLFSTKGGNQSEQFLIQEGIPTSDTYSGFPIEPVMYGIGQEAVSGFFRIHQGKNPYESLNAPGMNFSCLCLHKLDEPHESDFIDCKAKEELVQGSYFLAKLAALAAAKEQ